MSFFSPVAWLNRRSARQASRNVEVSILFFGVSIRSSILDHPQSFFEGFEA
jgi:hypothetical protein